MNMPSRHTRAGHAHHDSHEHGATAKAGDSLKDPVCGMNVTAQSAHQVEHEGLAYYFCSSKCQAKFSAETQNNVGGAPDAAPTAPVPAQAGTIYTCPMHPEIRQDHPGSCPKCGMALEPVMPTLEDEENPELVDFSRRFWWTH